MKIAVSLLLSFFCLTAFAENPENMEKKMEKMSFEDAKKMHLDKLNEMSGMIEKRKSCVSQATDKEGLKKCREEGRTEWQKKREENKAKRKERKEKK